MSLSIATPSNVSAARRAFPVTALGILWGIALSAMESFSLPLADDSAAAISLLMLGQILVWSSVGVGIAWCVDWAGPRLRSLSFLVSVLVIGSLGFSALASMLIAIIGHAAPRIGVPIVFPNGTESLASFLFQTWLILFYGGFYVLARRFGQRAEASRTLLEESRIARIQSEMSLTDAELRALRGRIEPGFLLQVMEEVNRRYESAPGEADHLVKLLVDMLRQAMPGLRTGDSTLAAELALADAYCTLKRNLSSDAPVWTIDVPDISGDLPFPAMLIVPLLERLNLPRDAERTAKLVVQHTNDTLTIDFFRSGVSATTCLSEGDLYRARVALSALLGDRAMLRTNAVSDGVSPAVRISVRRETPMFATTPFRTLHFAT